MFADKYLRTLSEHVTCWLSHLKPFQDTWPVDWVIIFAYFKLYLSFILLLCLYSVRRQIVYPLEALEQNIPVKDVLKEEVMFRFLIWYYN